MPVATWWRGDPLPALPGLPGLTTRPVADPAEAGTLTGLPPAEVARRWADGNTLHGAFLHEQAAGYGWLARTAGRIDELWLAWSIPPGEAYLWDFVTRPEARGRGVYPLLLQAMLATEASISRFWIGYEGHNRASARGIEKAGFQVVGDLAVHAGRLEGVTLADGGPRGAAFARLFPTLPVLAP
ncbi:MAG: GNAT family N-acetyltransferase [Chloroflexi bacterium]|nr:GNAT family N-acetyltransferase [Chloroflexota bacterium]